MITPWLKGLVSWKQAPLTWMLIGLNVFLFLAFSDGVKKDFANKLYTSEQIRLTGVLYSQYLGNEDLPPQDEVETLGLRALRDKEFLDQVEGLDFTGDEIAIARWKENLREFRDTMEKRSIHFFGYRSEAKILNLLTYQFVHAGWVHLLGNMLMFLIFAGALEIRLGSLVLLGVYLTSGFAGAMAYDFWASSSSVPMVGASASLSGLIGFYAFFERKKRVSFFYFLSPFKGYYGWIYLPTLVILPFTFASDLSALLTSSEDFSPSIAYSAHIGGALLGIVLGIMARSFHWEQSPVAWYFRSHNEVP